MLWIVVQVCEAATRAHVRGVVHGSLEPRNVMLDEQGRRVLILRSCQLGSQDSTEDEPTTGPDSLPARSAYMAPEQAWGRLGDLDVRTDVYGIGGILHALLTGKPPHRGGSPEADLALARLGTLHPIEALLPEPALLEGLWRIARRALSADPSQRYPSVAILQADIARTVLQLAPHAGPPHGPHQPAR